MIQLVSSKGSRFKKHGEGGNGSTPLLEGKKELCGLDSGYNLLGPAGIKVLFLWTLNVSEPEIQPGT